MSTVTNIKIQPMTVEWASSALGFTDGDLEFTTDEQSKDIVAHEEGTNILTSIRTGKTVEITVTLKETNKALLENIYKQGGAYVTASGAASAVVAWGNSKDFTQVTTQAGKLVLHPVVKAASDLSEDIAAWSAYPIPNSLSFSGENESLLTISFRIYPDLTKADSLRLFMIGDHTDGTFTAIE